MEDRACSRLLTPTSSPGTSRVTVRTSISSSTTVSSSNSNASAQGSGGTKGLWGRVVTYASSTDGLEQRKSVHDGKRAQPAGSRST